MLLSNVQSLKCCKWQNGTQPEDPSALTTLAPGLYRISSRGLSLFMLISTGTINVLQVTNKLE